MQNFVGEEERDDKIENKREIIIKNKKSMSLPFTSYRN